MHAIVFTKVIPSVTLGASLVAGCAIPVSSHVKAPAVHIEGTLYLTRPTHDPEYDIVTIRNGSTVSVVHSGTRVLRPGGIVRIMARDRPRVYFLVSQRLFGQNHISQGRFYSDATVCEPMAISPHGLNAACLRNDGSGSLTLFRISDPRHTQVNTRIQVGTIALYMMAFVSDSRLAVLADDESCPFFRRPDGHYDDKPQARVEIIDMEGRTISRGICAHGVVAGAGQLAYWQHEPSGDSVYSLDGRTWNPGIPAAFDGTGSLLIIDDAGDLVDTRGRLVATNVSSVQWTR